MRKGNTARCAAGVEDEAVDFRARLIGEGGAKAVAGNGRAALMKVIRNYEYLHRSKSQRRKVQRAANRANAIFRGEPLIITSL